MALRDERPDPGRVVHRVADDPVALDEADEPVQERLLDRGDRRGAGCRPSSSRPCSRRSRSRRGPRPGRGSAASAMTICGLLPPSSRATRLRFVCAACSRTVRPTSVEPVKATPSMPGGGRCAVPTTEPGPVTTFRTPSGQAGLGAELRDPEQRQRGHRRRLHHDRVARREDRPELPGGHLERVVPGHDRADDPERLADDHRDGARPGRGDLVVELVGRLGVPADRRGRVRDVERAGVADRLADVERLDPGELLAVRVDEVGEALEDLLAVRRRGRRPARRRPPGGRDRPSTSSTPPSATSAIVWPVRRVLDLVGPAADRVDEVAADEGLRAEADLREGVRGRDGHRVHLGAGIGSRVRRSLFGARSGERERPGGWAGVGMLPR